MRLRTLAIAALCLAGVTTAGQRRPVLELSEGPVRLFLSSDSGRPTFRITLDGRPVVEESPLGIVVDGVDLGERASLGKAERYRSDERYEWRGVHSQARNRFTGARVQVQHPATPYTLDVRVFADAVGIRYIVAGTGSRVPDAGMAFRMPHGSLVWSHGLRDHYEAVYERRRVEDVPSGDWAAPPATFKLPDGAGYAAIMEADLRNYAGMALQADGQRGYRERLGHTHPPSYPYTLRYGEENARRLAIPAAIEGEIVTPWRVVLAGRDLNTLVNSDAIANLSPPPDPALFPQGIRTPWVKPGRAVWRYLDGGESSVAGIKEFSRLASELGFEYQVVEGQWQKWSEADLRDVLEYSSARGVRLILWRHRNTLGDQAQRRELFASLKKLGVAGLKVDFLDHEAKEVIDLYQDILRDAAAEQLVINFHGSNKPAGEARTWPNELTREGIYGLEHRSAKTWAAFNASFPFVRMLAGHADYTPVVFGERRRETSWAHQIASAAILTSPLLVYGGHPASLLASPAAEMIKAIPSVWDETRVLPGSEIGELALFARRSGDRWFVAAMNGPVERTVKVELAPFAKGRYRALIVRDRLDRDDALEVETRDVSGPLEIPTRAGGGFVVRLTPTR